jgi:hypothetical protein
MMDAIDGAVDVSPLNACSSEGLELAYAGAEIDYRNDKQRQCFVDG